MCNMCNHIPEEGVRNIKGGRCKTQCFELFDIYILDTKGRVLYTLSGDVIAYVAHVTIRSLLDLLYHTAS